MKASNDDKFKFAYKQYIEFVTKLNELSDDATQKERQSVIDKLLVNQPEEYKEINKHYANYHKQNACGKCKYFKQRFSDNVCEKFHCYVEPFGICEKFKINL